ncbi:uncharacterized protein LOC130906159 isoform X2 [Corythoichthys intestinalis]|uniref:uncharacterized protein LOC130906159 isoform X2 n=1 Tax=Corythoichthys intestinalis TaxID=161448 RepID=UPI0025A611B5|nr:uncharacterized protein LOC130906159 isoform X2 [Corythoichthys intestinalis]
MHAKVVLRRLEGVSQVHRPEHQESACMEEEEEEESPYVEKVEVEFVHIKKYFIGVENPHIEEQQRPHPLKKEEDNPPYVKVEVVDIPKWTDETLMGEDEGPSEASTGAEPLSGSSSSKEGFQADNLIARPSENEDFTSHSVFSLNSWAMCRPRSASRL